MPRPSGTYFIDLDGHYIDFEGGAVVRKVWREKVQQRGPVNALALRLDLCKSFLPGGRNERTGEQVVPHIAFLQVCNPGNRAVLDTNAAPKFEVI